jgi:hypothetical protein
MTRSHPNEDIFSTRPFAPEVHPTPSREEEDLVIEFGQCGRICRTNQGKFMFVFHDDDCQPCAVFETIEDCRKFNLDLSLAEDTFCHFKDWGQKKHYERRRMHSLRAIRQLTKTWGERRIPSYFKYELGCRFWISFRSAKLRNQNLMVPFPGTSVRFR